MEKKAGIKLINFIGNEPQKYQALKQYRQAHQADYIRLSVSETLEEFDWIAEINREQKKFSLQTKGLFLGLEQGNKTIEIVGIERNPEMLGVIESIVLLECVRQRTLKTMIPGLNPIDLKSITIIFETEDKLDEIYSGVMEWKQLKYYNVSKNKV